MARSLANLMGLGMGAQSAKLINGIVADGLVSTGTTQADALPLSGDVNVVALVVANSGVLLPAVPQPSDEIEITNLGANALLVYPSPGGSVQGGAANTPFSLPSGATATFIARQGSANWIALASSGSAAPPPTLGTLALSATTFTVGTPSSGTITGATVGSTITASGLPTGLTINGVARTWAWDGTGTAGSGSFTLTETLAGYSNSPHANVISYSIVAASSAPVLSNPTNTGQWDTLLPATAFVGDSVHLLIFSDSGLTTQVQHLVKMITPDEMAGGGGASNWSVLATPPPRDATTGVITGLAMGVGPRWWYEYIQRDDGTTSPNSNVLNSTIIATVGNLPNLQVWLDPSDLTTMFKDTAGTVPVTADGDAVALILDKSGNGNHFQQATAGLRPLYHTAAGISWLAFDGVDDVLESTNLNIGCATAVIGMRIDSTNGPWVGFLGERAAQASPAVGYAWIRESSNNNFFSRTSDAGSLADDTHLWRNKVNQTKTFTPNTIEVYSGDGTGRAAGAITFGGTTLVLGADPSAGSGNAKINFYGLILAGSTDTQILSANDRHTAEDYIASKSGAY